MIAQNNDIRPVVPIKTNSFDSFVSHMSEKRLCLSMSFLLPFVAVAVIYLDECLFAGMNIAAVILPGVIIPAVLAGFAGGALYLTIKYARFLHKHC